MVSGRRRRSAIGWAVALCAFLVPADALADGSLGTVGGFTYFQTSATMIPQGHSAAAAICPPGSGRIVGGGFDADTGSIDGMAVESTPVDTEADADRKPDDGWRTGAVDLRTANANLASYAVCSNAKVSYASATQTVKRGAVGKLQALCPQGTSDSAGGMQTGDFDRLQLSASFPVDGPDQGGTPDDGWAVKYFNRGGKATVTVWAVCMKGAQISYVDDTAFPIPPGAPQDVQGSVCDDPFHVTGGGAAYAPSLSTIETRLSAVFPLDAGFDPTDPGETVPDDRMDYQVTNGNPVAGGKVHRFRICVSG